MDLPDFASPLSPAFNSGEKFFSRKNIITFLLVGISLLVIPVGVKLVQEQQLLKSKATGNEIAFVPKEGVVGCSESGECVTKDTKVAVNLTSPFGEPGDLLPTATPTPTPGPNAPFNLSQSCSADGNSVTFSWNAPTSGITSTGYTLRADKVQDVWAPSTDCDAKTTLCKGREESGDFIPPNVTGASYTALIVPGAKYGWSIQAAPNSGVSDRRTIGGSFSCSTSGEKTQIAGPGAAGNGAPTGVSVSCSAGNQNAVSATFSWTPPTSGGTPTGYALRVNQDKNVWAPDNCDAKTAPCKGREESGDFVPPSVTGTNFIATIVPNSEYGWSIQAVPNSGSDRRAVGGSFTCAGPPGRR